MHLHTNLKMIVKIQTTKDFNIERLHPFLHPVSIVNYTTKKRVKCFKTNLKQKERLKLLKKKNGEKRSKPVGQQMHTLNDPLWEACVCGRSV